MNENSKEQKVFNLTVELADLTAKKKVAVKAFNEEIKRVKAELNELISDKKETFEII